MNEKRDDFAKKVNLGAKTLLTGYHSYGLYNALRTAPPKPVKVGILLAASLYGVYETNNAYKELKGNQKLNK